MPGVLVVEAMAQIAAVLMSFRPDFDRIVHWCYGESMGYTLLERMRHFYITGLVVENAAAQGDLVDARVDPLEECKSALHPPAHPR